MREQQRQLELALAQGVQQAIAAQHATTKANIDTIFSVALGYMGARILEDKGFFGEIHFHQMTLYNSCTKQ